MNEIEAIRHAVDTLRRDLGEIWKARIFKLRAIAALGRRTLSGDNQTVNNAMADARKAASTSQSRVEAAFPGAILPPHDQRLDFNLAADDDVMRAFNEAAGWEGLAELNLPDTSTDTSGSGNEKPEGKN